MDIKERIQRRRSKGRSPIIVGGGCLLMVGWWLLAGYLFLYRLRLASDQGFGDWLSLYPVLFCAAVGSILYALFFMGPDND